MALAKKKLSNERQDDLVVFCAPFVVYAIHYSDPIQPSIQPGNVLLPPK